MTDRFTKAVPPVSQQPLVIFCHFYLRWNRQRRQFSKREFHLIWYLIIRVWGSVVDKANVSELFQEWVANRCANAKAVGMSFLERIWQKKFSKSSLKVATSLIKLLNPGLTSFRKSLNDHNDSLSRFFFPFLCFLCFPMLLMPSTALRRLANDSDSDVFQ